ncbi:hypothetical protein BDZ89DRAFT_1065226 [Hymenopellis radicata]|nr:hypothetical protein BDZ89DRAFT_1065226 [Hymenopellis radicata]
MFFGFLLPDNEVVRQHPAFAELMSKYSDREICEARVRSAVIQSMTWQLQSLWHRVRLDSTSSGSVIVLAHNTSDDTISVPSPEVLKRMQEMMQLPEEIKAKWMRVHTA